VKSGGRVLGVAESYKGDQSTVAGTVVRADRIVDGFAFGTCTVGGTDATDAVLSVVDRLGRADIQALMIAGIAPAWYNVIDLRRLQEATDLPTLSISFETSPGLEAAIAAAFDGEERRRRLATYRAQPPRQPVADANKATATDGDEDDQRGDEPALFVRAVGLSVERAAAIVRTVTENGRPEPVRVARLAARAADQFRR
jgi:endonuclease V-like protein UPF0215 family